MKTKKETILQTNEVSSKRYFWYLLILGGIAIFGGYLLISMQDYQRENNPYTMAELVQRAFENDAALLFVALVIPASAVVAHFLVKACTKLEVVVTDQSVYGRLFFGSEFNLPLESITAVEKVSSTTLQISSTYGITKLRLLSNCNEIYEALTGEPVPVTSRAEMKKQARITAFRQLNNDDLLTKMGTMQAAQRLAYITLVVLALGCIIAASIPFIQYGFDYGMSIAPAYLLLFLLVLAIFAYPLYYIITRNNAIFAVISHRAAQYPEMNNWKEILTRKRHRATKILVSIIIICPVICGVAAVGMGGNTGSNHASDRMVTCSSCHREFKRSSENGKSIAKRNMCELCYDNMNDMQDALDELGKK